MVLRSSCVRLAALPLALAATLPAHAQTPTLRETVVTGTRTLGYADELVSDVRVIDRAQIEASTARTLTELLARTAGVQMSANGGRGKTSNIFIRGAENRHTILLVDGVRYGSATAGTPGWETIPVDLIERIEVLKGPASALYGSEGVGGVIQVFTRKGQEGFHPHASLTAGSRGFRSATAGFAAGQGPLRYSATVRRERERGLNSTQPYVPFGNFNADIDPFRQDAVNANLSYRLAPDWSADGGVLHSDGISWFDDGPATDSRTAIRALTVHAGVRGRVAGPWHTELRAWESQDTANNIVAALAGAFETRQTQWSWQNTIDSPIGLVLAGVEQRQQNVKASAAYAVTGRRIDSVFGGVNGQAGPHSWQFNLRRDRNSQFGDADTGFVGYGFRLAAAWRVHAAHGTSFVAPSFNQLYFPGFGNPALLPERGRNTDLGVSWTQGVHEARLVRFDNRIRGFMTNTTLPVNVPRARIDGWTLGYVARLGATALRADFERIDPVNQVTQRQLPRRAGSHLTLGTDHRVGAWSFGGTLQHVGRRFDDAANTRPLGSYTTLDLHADWQFAKDLSLQAKLNNATDKAYETAYGYNQPGRGAYLTLRWQPK